MESSPRPSLSLDRLSIGLFLVSLTGLAYEITLTRVFSIAQWYHFAYMIISMAMLGFAAAGTFLALVDDAIVDRLQRLLVLLGGLLVVSLPVCYGLSQRIPFETIELINQPVQMGYLAVLYLLLSVPFFLVSAIIVICFRYRPERVGVLYFGNLVGSGTGALGSVALMYYLPPGLIIYLLCLPAVLATAAFGVRSRAMGMLLGGLVAVVLLVVMVTGYVEVRISEYKPLNAVLRSPDSHVAETASSPVSTIHAVVSPQLRESPGQISGYPFQEKGPLPAQVGLYLDGGGPTVINRADSPADLDRFAFLDYVTGALPYHLRSPDRVAVLGTGGGTGIWNALYHGADSVLALEVDPGVYNLMADRFRSYSGHLYHREEVRPVQADARGYFETHRGERTGLMQLTMTKSFSASASGVHALSENYLLTVDAFERYVAQLNEDGMIAVTRWVNTPPRGSLKILATMIEAARRSGLSEPGRHLAVVRSWNTLTAVLSKSKLKESEVKGPRSFVRSRSFDPVYYPGINRAETNNSIKLSEPIFYESTRQMLRSPESFYHRYVFSVRPATDNRPYFNNFFKWRSLDRIIEQLGNRTVQFLDWGYLVLLFTLIQAVPIALLLLAPPLIWPAGSGTKGMPAFVTGLYFFLLGLGFMFLEIAYIQVFMRFLSYPVYSVSVVLTGFLVFSGMGSYWTDRYVEVSESRLVTGAVGVLVLLVVGYSLGLESMFSAFVTASDAGKITLTLGLLLPVAFVLGIPFPAGLRLASSYEASLVPLAWAANGCSSVVGSILAIVLAMQFGFDVLIFTALAVYAVAAPVLYGLERRLG